MIAWVEGKLAEKGPSRAVVDVGGVGYDLLISLSTFEDLPDRGDRVRVLAHPYQRDDGLQLYGFSTAAERDLFRLLLGVPGVGPKVALAILSTLRPEPFRRAVREGDTGYLTRIPGIGKKSAERLVVELRGKFEDEGGGAGGLPGGPAGPVEEARLALEALGFKPDRVGRAIEKALGGRKADEISTEELVREALTFV